MVFSKCLLENTLTVPPYNFEAASELDLLKVAPCILVLSSHHIGKCATRELMRPGKINTCKTHLIFVPVKEILENMKT